MALKHLAAYLNDHLAGSVMIIDLLTHVAAAYDGTEVERFATTLRTDVIADRTELETIMSALQIGQSSTRKASAWLAEKATLLKLRWDDPAGGALHLLEAAEAMSVGIAGKQLLWKSLSVASEKMPELTGPDYARLIGRAEEQRGRVEAIRANAVLFALSGDAKAGDS